MGPRAGGLRLIRIVLACVAFGVVINSAGSYYLWQQNTAQVRQVNDERLRNTAAGCVLASGQNRAILTFLQKRRADDETLADARPLFPVRTAAECDAVARGQVETP